MDIEQILKISKFNFAHNLVKNSACHLFGVALQCITISGAQTS